MKTLITIINKKEASLISNIGFDVIDIKNPEEGSLGAPVPKIIKEVQEALPKNTIISIPVGDVPYLPGTVSLACMGACCFKPDYVKVGLRGVRTLEEAANLLFWVVNSVRIASSETKIVAAVYAEYMHKSTLDPLLLPEIAGKIGIDTCLIDTLIKDGRSLLQHLSVDYLKEFVSSCHAQGLNASLAGSLGLEDLPKIAMTGADIIGVRGGICKNRCRKGSLDAKLAAEFVSVSHQA